MKSDAETRSPVEAELQSVRDVIRAIKRMRKISGFHDPDVTRMLQTAIAMEQNSQGATVTVTKKRRAPWETE